MKRTSEEICLKRTISLFEQKILVEREEMNLKDHYRVLRFNQFSMRYEPKPPFDNGQADVIIMCSRTNDMLDIWLSAYAACSSDLIDKYSNDKKL